MAEREVHGPVSSEHAVRVAGRHRQREPPSDLALRRTEPRSSSTGRCRRGSCSPYRSGSSSPYRQRQLDDAALRRHTRSACCVQQPPTGWSERPSRSTGHLPGCPRDVCGCQLSYCASPAVVCRRHSSRRRHRHRPATAGHSHSRSRSGERSRHRERRRLPRQAQSLDCRPQAGRPPLLRQSTVGVSDEEYLSTLESAGLAQPRSVSQTGSSRSPLGSCRSVLARQSTCDAAEESGHRRSAASSLGSRSPRPGSALSCTTSLVDLTAAGADMAAPMLPVLAQVLRTRATLAQRGEKRLDQRLRWAVIITGLLLLAAAVVMVGVTLKMAPIIDDMGEWSRAMRIPPAAHRRSPLSRYTLSLHRSTAETVHNPLSALRVQSDIIEFLTLVAPMFPAFWIHGLTSTSFVGVGVGAAKNVTGFRHAPPPSFVRPNSQSCHILTTPKVKSQHKTFRR